MRFTIVATQGIYMYIQLIQYPAINKYIKIIKLKKKGGDKGRIIQYLIFLSTIQK